MMAGTSTSYLYNNNTTLPVRIKTEFIQEWRDLSRNSYLIFLTLLGFLFLKLKNIQKKHTIFVISYSIICTVMISFLLGLTCHSNHNKCELKACTKTNFFTVESINLTNKISICSLKSNMSFLMMSNLKLGYRNQSLLLKFLLLLSGDISLNPGPNRGQTMSGDDWKLFKKRGLHLLHVNINSLLPKIDEIRYIAKMSNAAVIGLTESKLDDSVLDSEINIDGYEVLRCDRNRNGGGVACFVREDIGFNVKNCLSKDIEYIFFDVLLPKTKPFSVGIFYRPPSKANFLELLTDDFVNLSPESNELYILGDFNINLFHQGINVFKADNRTSIRLENIPSLTKQYKEFCSVFGLNQIIQEPTRTTCSTSSLIDHILTNCTDKISQSGVVNIGLSDHQLIFCTRKTMKTKFNMHKQIKFRSFKNYSKEIFQNALQQTPFPNYENFSNINLAYSDFMDKLMLVVNKIAPIKEARVKCNSQEWFDGEIAEQITIRDKLFKKFKTSKLQIDRELYNEARNKVQSLIKKKKKTFYEEQLKDNVNKSKELWKTLKSLGTSNKKVSSSNICLEDENNNKKKSFDSKTNVEIFKEFFSELANNLLSKLPNPLNRFGITSSFRDSYYKNINIGLNKIFNFNRVSPETQGSN